MDHAGDVAHKLRHAYLKDSWCWRDTITEQLGDRERQVFIVTTSDGGVFRVTVDDVGYEGLTEDELHRDYETASVRPS